jgi:hypothetical protein
MQLAEYAIRNGLAIEPAFAWWVKQTVKKQKGLSNLHTQDMQRGHTSLG